MKEELSRYIEHFLDLSNPVIYALIICGVIVLMCYIFYFHMYIPQKKQIIQERMKAELKHSKLMIEKYRFLSLQLQEKLEMEKQRLGRELHDSIGQNLLFMKMKVTNKFGNDGKEVLNVIDSTIKDLREITYDLRPRALQDLGLPAAVINLLDYVNKNSNVSGEVSISGEPRTLENKKELYLYRVIQETLNNIIKHSGASDYHIQLEYEESSLKIIAFDDGTGIDFNSPDFSKGSGLLNIEERIKSMGGSIKIKSDKEEGTIIIMEVPYD